MAAVSSPIIHQCHEALDVFQGAVQVYAPFTYLSYRSIIPSAQDDLIELATKICDVVYLHFLVNLAAAAIHPVLYLIPYVPFLLDMGRILYHLISSEPFEQMSASPEISRSPWRRIGSIGLLALGLAGVYSTRSGVLFKAD